MELYCSLALGLGHKCAGLVGDFEAVLLGIVESTLRYHPFLVCFLTREQARGQCLMGSLTGAVAS